MIALNSFQGFYYLGYFEPDKGISILKRQALYFEHISFNGLLLHMNDKHIDKSLRNELMWLYDKGLLIDKVPSQAIPKDYFDWSNKEMGRM